MARKITLAEFSTEDISELEKQLSAEKKKRERDRIKLARAAAIEAIKPYGVTLNDLLGKGAGNNRGKVAPIYRNPKHPNQTWSNRGRQPKWVSDYIAAGGKLEDMRIDTA